MLWQTWPAHLLNFGCCSSKEGLAEMGSEWKGVHGCHSMMTDSGYYRPDVGSDRAEEEAVVGRG